MTDWMNWMGCIATKGRLAGKGNSLSMSKGKTAKPGNAVTDGLYTKTITDAQLARRLFKLARITGYIWSDSRKD